MSKLSRPVSAIFLVLSIAASGQYTKEFKRIYFDAEYLYQTGFYEEAFSRYKNLLTLDPGNSNILFHCGACCLNINGSEQQAITFLKEAAGGVTRDFKERSHKESAAPVLTLFMLGRAYHLHNEFDRAVEQYERYLFEGTDEDPVQRDYTQLQIDACRRAEKVVEGPPAFEFQSVLDQFQDDLPSCSNPVVSGDGNSLIFLVDYPSDKKVMMTRRKEKVWSRPVVINSEIGMVGETYPACLSFDGKELYLIHQYYSHSDIFVSRLEGNRWSQAVPLGSNVNGRTSETHASVSRDGQTLYFTSDERGSLGSFDIFVSRKDSKGEWGLPANLGPVINTPYEEHTPFISGNDSILFFSSQGHSSIGGIDVFFSELGQDGAWMEPVNLGYPVNTTGENLFFNPGWNELDGYYAVQREDDPTSTAINMVIELEPVPEVVARDTPLEETPDTQVEETPDTPLEEARVTPLEKTPDNVTFERAMEPEVTDEILEVLNRSEEGGDEDAPPVPAMGERELRTSVPFDYNEAELGMAALLEVEKVADLMQAHPSTTVTLTGHADATGSPAYNMLLSGQRAEQIALYLELRGIDPSRITLEGKGSGAPVARNSYPDGSDAPLGRYLNRQVTVTICSPEPIKGELSGFYVPLSLRPSGKEGPPDAAGFWFTIQLSAHQNSLEVSSFKGLTGVASHCCKDGFFRYTIGSYRTFSEARQALKEIHLQGFPDAFIQTLEWYRQAAE